MVEKDPWDDVSDRFARLGKRLKAAADGGAKGDRDAVADAFKSFVASLDDAAASLNKAVQDPKFRDDAKAAAKSLGDAVAASFEQIGDDLRGRFRREGKA